MGLVVAATAAASQPRDEGAVAGAARVAEACLEAACPNRADIDLLMNLGTYRDGNQLEPAAAACVQRALAINVDPLRDGFERTTFSFDLSHGPDCFLAAAQVADALAQTGAVRQALLVSANAASVDASAAGLARARTASAIILRASGPATGFMGFAFHPREDAAIEMSGYCDPGEYGPGAAGHVITTPSPMPAAQEEFVLDSARDWLARADGTVGPIAAVLSSHSNPAFDRRLRSIAGPEPLGLPDRQTGAAFCGSSLMLAWDAARRSGRLPAGGTILLVEAGPVSAAFALYRNPAGSGPPDGPSH
jgi:hypothetical protein